MKNTSKILLLTLFAACAKIVPPTGGDKDVTPPVVLKQSPTHLSLNNTVKQVVIQFDEYVKLKNPNDNIIISPLPSNRPSYKIKQKQLVITFDEYLKHQTTYTINYIDAIVDNNESNPLSKSKAQPLIFSTGDFLDSFSIKGKVISNKVGNISIGSNVYLYPDSDTTDPFKQKPLYFTRTDSFGYFQFKYLPPATFKLGAQTDDNNNKLYDVDEELAKLTDVVSEDSAISTLYVSKEIQPIRTQLFKHYKNGVYVVTTSNKMLQLILTDSNSTQKNQLPVSTSSLYHDTITYYSQKHMLSDSFNISLEQNDSVYYHAKLKRSVNVIHNSLLVNPRKSNEKYILIESKIPVGKMANSSFTILQDSITFTGNLNPRPMRQNLHLTLKTTSQSQCKLVIPDSTILLANGEYHPADTVVFMPFNAENFGSVVINFKPNIDTTNLYIIIKEREEVINAFPYKSIVSLSQMLPGSYSIEVFRDQNNNQKLDLYPYLSDENTERVYKHSTKVRVKQNWDNIIPNITLPDWL